MFSVKHFLALEAFDMGNTFQDLDIGWEWAKQNLPMETMTAKEVEAAITEHFKETPNVRHNRQ